MIKQLRYLCTLLLIAVASVAWGDTYEQLTSINDIDESAQYVLGIDGTGFHYEGTSSWGKTALPAAQTPIYYTLTKASDGSSFTASATISGETYYLQIPTSNTFSMATKTGTNTDIIIGTTQVSGTNYAVANKNTTARHLRINGTSGLRSYAGTTGSMAFFYKVVKTTNPEISFEISSKTIAVGETYTQTATTQNAEGFAVTYTSSDEDVATVNASTGEVEGVSAGTTTITAKITANGTDYSGSYEIKVIEVVDGLFDFTLGYGYGSGLSVNADGSYITDDHTWTAGGVTLVTSGKYRWWSDGTIRVFSPDEGNTTLTLSVPEGKVITKIEITGANDYKTLNVDKGTYTDGTWIGSAQTVVFSKGSANAQIKTITVTYGVGTEKQDPGLAFSSTTATANIGETFTAPTLSYAEGFDGTITYSSSNTDVATVDATTGAVTIKAAGKAKITASAPATDNYLAGEVSYTITVIDPNAPGSTAENPYTVAQARAAIDDNASITGVYVTGIVSKVDSYNSKYHSITYWISADGTTTADQLEVYSGKGINGADFESIDEILLGDEVTVYGNLKKYNDTYEFDLNNELVSLTRPEKPAVTVSFNEPTTTVNIHETVTNVASADVEGVSVVYSSSDENVATVNASGVVTGVAAGTATITATIAEAADYNVTEASYTITVSDPNPPVGETFTFAKVADVSTLADGDEIIIVGETTSDEVTTYYAMGEQRDNNRGAVSIIVTNGETSVSTVDGVQIITLEKSGNYWNLNTGNGYLYAASSSKNYLKTEASVDADGNATATIYPLSIVFNGPNERNIMQFNFNNGSPIFACYAAASQSPVTFYKKVESTGETEEVPVNQYGKGTYVTKKALDFTGITTVTAYVATAQNGSDVTFDPVTKVPAGTPLLVKGATTDVPVIASATAPAVNLLVAGTGAAVASEAGGKFNFILNYLNGAVGFYRAAENTVAANRAYLSLSENITAAKLNLIFSDEETTGINNVNAVENTNEKVFNLAGQQIKSAVKGVYIKNGKKYVK